MRNLNEITQKIIGCAIEVHRNLGPGMLESAYQTCLVHELKNANLKVKTEVPVSVIYKDIKLDQGYRIDILVEEKIVIELKSVESITEVHHAQVLTYLKFAKMPIGLLINFNVKLLTKGLKRFTLQ